MNLLAIVITYFPNKAETERNLRRIIESVDKLIVWENTPLGERANYRVELPEFAGKVVYMGVESNKCIAFPINRAIEYGKEHGFTHLLSLDQDSCFAEGHFAKYRNLVENCPEKLALFGPNSNNFYPKNEVLSPKTIITSGTIYNLELFDKIGYFREDYAIDCVDYEMCFRALRHGYRCLVFGSVSMAHEIGYPQRSKFGYITANYSPFRCYHIARNNIWLRRDYPEYVPFYQVWSNVTHPIVKIILSENNKCKKIAAILRGIKDGIKRR